MAVPPSHPRLPHVLRPPGPLSPVSVLICIVLAATGCEGESEKTAPIVTAQPGVAATRTAAAPAPPALGGGYFTEVTAHLGFEASPARYPDGTYMTPEITPGGVALFDYDNDGRLDVLLVPSFQPLTADGCPNVDNRGAAAPSLDI